MGLENWKTTPSLNSDTPPDGWPEGTMTVNQINDTGRQMMADVRAWYEDEGWNDMGDTHAYASATTTTIASDVTATYTAERRVRADGSATGTIYGKIVSSVYSAPNTTITYEWDGVAPAGLSNEALTISVSFIASNVVVPAPNSAATPTRQIFLTGSGTYTTPDNVTWLDVEMVGGGGGGGGSGVSGMGAGGAGVDTTFATLTASAGAGGGAADVTNGGAGGIGGAAAGGDINIPGGYGISSDGGGPNNNSGGSGGSSFLGGSGSGGIGATAGNAGRTNTGGGGGGGGQNGSGGSGAGGGAGGCVRMIISGPAATYAYAVGTGGIAGIAGSGGVAGGAGAAGIIVVTEYYT